VTTESDRRDGKNSEIVTVTGLPLPDIRDR